MFRRHRLHALGADAVRRETGFTLIELMIVILVIGILAVIGLANFQSMREKAKYASCMSNQKHVHEAAVVYSMDNNLGTIAINVSDLWGAELITQEAGECPSSGTADFDDYDVEYTIGDVTELTCSIKGVRHLYTP